MHTAFPILLTLQSTNSSPYICAQQDIPFLSFVKTKSERLHGVRLDDIANGKYPHQLWYSFSESFLVTNSDIGPSLRCKLPEMLHNVPSLGQPLVIAIYKLEARLGRLTNRTNQTNIRSLQVELNWTSDTDSYFQATFD